MSEVIATNQTILVVGGGISGMTAALEAAECGKQVILVEKNPSLGGRVSQLYKYFPKLCHPKCGMEINLRRIKANRNLRVMAMTEVSAISGDAGNYSVTLKTSPRYVNENCTSCGACGDAVEAEFDSEYNYGLGKRKGAYLPFNQAYPERYVLDPAIIGTDDAVYMHAGHKISQGVWEVSTYAGSIRFGVNAVIGFYSTSMLTAMAMDKMVIMYLPQNFLKVRFADYFGIQVVRNLEEINWNDNTMKQKRVQKEVLSDVTDVEILDRWLNLSTNKVKDKI